MWPRKHIIKSMYKTVSMQSMAYVNILFQFCRLAIAAELFKPNYNESKFYVKKLEILFFFSLSQKRFF